MKFRAAGTNSKVWTEAAAAIASTRRFRSVRYITPFAKRPPVLPEAFLLALDLALLRRLQAGRVEPFGEMRCGVGPPCPEQQFLALLARRKHLGSFAVSFSLNAKPLFQRDRLLETSSLHDALLWFD
jgi:hypothetical protein